MRSLPLLLLLSSLACRSKDKTADTLRGVVPTPSPTIAKCLVEGHIASCLTLNRLAGDIDLQSAQLSEHFLEACSNERPEGCYLGLEIVDTDVRDWRIQCDQQIVHHIKDPPADSFHPLVEACRDRVSTLMDSLRELRPMVDRAREVLDRRCKAGSKVDCMPFALDSWRDREVIKDFDLLCQGKTERTHIRCFRHSASEETTPREYQDFVRTHVERYCEAGFLGACTGSMGWQQAREKRRGRCDAGDWVACYYLASGLGAQIPGKHQTQFARDFKHASLLSPFVDSGWRSKVLSLSETK